MLKGVLRLPEDKLHHLQREVRQWMGRRLCIKRDLLSLIGQLRHVCCVVQPGKTSLRRIINLSTIGKQLHHNIRLNKCFKSDLSWWSLFLPIWNGIGMMVGIIKSTATAVLTSDASGN